MAYAKGTKIKSEKSMAEVRSLLFKNKAEGVGFLESGLACSVIFNYEGLPYKFTIPYPLLTERSVTHDKKGKLRTEKSRINYVEGEKDRLWRCLLLFIKAAIEAHNAGVVPMKRTFMSHLLTADGNTIYERAGDRLNKIAQDPTLLLA